jgi:peptidoglycan/xylan/chitin deacetylase (PgdA/CDA1 family)
MTESCVHTNRRGWLQSTGNWLFGGVSLLGSSTLVNARPVSGHAKARIAITLDLEMARNFPRREDTHWDYEKGNLNDAAKNYSVEAAKRVKQRGGSIHFFCVGRVLEQPDVSWLQQIAKEGHPIGNHTYDHVNVLAQSPQELQFRFQRSPWLIEGKSTDEVIYENIRLTTAALKQRTQIENRGFRTPGGFNTGLHGREDLQRMLLELGFTWVSSLYPAHDYTAPGVEPTESIYQSLIAATQKAQPFVYPTGLVEIPMSPISDIGAFRTGQWKLEWFLEAIRRVVGWTIDNKATFDFLAHPSSLGVVDPEFKTIELICDLVQAAADVAEIVDLDQIAATPS